MKTLKQMEAELYKAAREELISGLEQCTPKQQQFFKRLYANGHLDRTIEQVVGSMPRDKLKRAMEQIQATLDKAAQ